MSKDLANFLDQFRLIKEKHDAVATANGERFNIFSVLGMESKELKHSALLAELLNPNGTHSRGAEFLRLFLLMLQVEFRSQFQWKLSDDEIGKFKVTLEKTTHDGRIDILLKSDDKCIVIENKINAGDQERQLGKYYDYAMKEFEKEDITVIYLTLRGDEPGYDTLGKNLDKEKVLCVSYSQHIIKWLENCLKETARIAHIRETLFQYQSLLKKLTGQTLHRKFIMDINKLFSTNKNYELVPELEEAIIAFKADLQFQFWEDVCAELKNAIGNKEFSTETESKKLDSQLEEIRAKEGYVQNDEGLTFNVLREDAHTEVVVRILDHNDGVFYCFQIRKEEIIINEGYDKGEYKDYVDIAKQVKNLNSDEGWCLGYNYTEPKLYFRHWDWNESLMLKMTCSDQRREIAKKLVSKVVESINFFVQGSRG